MIDCKLCTDKDLYYLTSLLSNPVPSLAQVTEYIFSAWTNSSNECMISIWATSYGLKALSYGKIYLN